MPSTGREDAVMAVVAGVVTDADGRVLIARRHAGSHQGGKWEFPGGKKQPGESAFDALARELAEELGIDVDTAHPFVSVRHSYPDRTVQLEVWRVSRFRGTAEGREGQSIRWVAVEDLDAFEFPEADRPVLRALRLPVLYLVTDARRFGPEVFLQHLERVLLAGAKLIQLREPHLDQQAFRTYALEVVELCHRHGAKVLLNAAVECVLECGADGIHLNGRRLEQFETRPFDSRYMVAASCHDSRQVHRARSLGADFIVLSPVLPTRSHPKASPLGWDGFGALCSTAGLPVYALGGMRAEDLGRAWRAGAQGISMLGGVWGTDPPESAVVSLGRMTRAYAGV
ncbi:MAG: Nudix family hydrolase [Acidiferrobacterales bacterium]